MITELDIFINEPLKIPNIEAAPNGADNRMELQGFIDRIERDLLTNSLGVALYATLETEIVNIDTASQEIKDLVNGVIYQVNGKDVRWNGLLNYSFLPYYINWAYLRKKSDIFTTMGIERTQAVNSSQTSSASREADLYREFLKMYQGGNAQPTVFYRRGGVGIDYSNTMTAERSLYQYMCDVGLDVSYFKFYDEVNTFGI